MIAMARAWVDLVAVNRSLATSCIADTLHVQHQPGEPCPPLHSMAGALHEAGNLAASAWFLGASSGRGDVDDRLTRWRRPLDETYQATLIALGEREFQRHYNAGAAASLDHIIEAALRALTDLANATISVSDPYGLTPREREILSLIATGASHDAIADTLFISRETVRTHTRKIHRKLGASSRAKVVSIAIREGLVCLND